MHVVESTNRDAVGKVQRERDEDARLLRVLSNRARVIYHVWSQIERTSIQVHELTDTVYIWGFPQVSISLAYPHTIYKVDTK